MGVCLRPRVLSGLVLTVLLSVTLAPRARGQEIAVGPGGGTNIGLPRPGTIVGSAWNADDTPIAHARLRLREAIAGQIAGVTRADEAGRFRFTDVPPGDYLVELVNEDNDVLAVGQIFGLPPAEAVATFVRLNADAPWYSGFFGSAAAAVLATAAAAGVTAIGDGGQPASPRF